MTWIKAHYIGLIVMILVGAIYGSHHIFISEILQENEYYPITSASSRDEGAFYLQRVNSVYQGEWISGDISIAGNEDSFGALPVLNPLILGGLGRVTGSLESGIIVSDFLFPPLIFIVLYLLAYTLTKRKYISLLFATVFIFAPKIFLTIPPISGSVLKEMISNIFSDPSNALYFSRIEYPKITFIFFALVYYLTYLGVSSKSRLPILGAGIFFGVTFYTYLFDWVHLLIGLAFFLLLLLIKKNFSAAKKIGLIIVIGLVISLFYWINFFQLQGAPYYDDLSARLGMEIGNEIRIETVWKSYARIIGLLALIYFVLWKRYKLTSLFLSSFLAVYFVVVNIQVITGFNIHPDHWHRTQFLVIGLTMLVLLVVLGKRYLPNVITKKKSIIIAILVIFLLASSLFGRYIFSKANATRYTLDQANAESYRWINSNIPKGSVVATIAGYTNNELISRTHAKTFLPNGFHTTISNDEIWDRFIITAKIFGITEKEFSAMIGDTGLLLQLFHDTYREKTFDSHFKTDPKRGLPEGDREKYMIAFGEQELRLWTDIPYQLDYIYDSGEFDSSADLIQLLPGLKTVYESDTIRIYKVPKS